MCAAVESAMAQDHHLIVQAGTGTGKSLAYLVPAALSGRRVVVATATKALQDQLANKDLPLVAEALSVPVRYAVLKGRSNYLCRQRAEELRERGFQGSLDEVPGTDDGATGEDGEPASKAPERLIEQLEALLRFADESETGDQADLSFEPHPRAWAMLSVGPRECPGAFRCPSGGSCFAEAARAAAADADIVVVNTHLYGAHLASGGVVLPPHDVVVFDEAHQLEAVMTESLGVEVTPGRLRALVNLARPFLTEREQRDALDALSSSAQDLHGALVSRVGERVLTGPSPGPSPPGREPGQRARTRATPDAPGGGTDAETRARDEELSSVLSQAAHRVATVTGSLRRDADTPSLLDDTADTGRMARALTAAGHLGEDLNRMAGRREGEVAWVDGTRSSPVLRLSPIDVGPPLGELLWGEVTAVLTSATIAPRLADQVGLREEHVELDVGSPFDYRTHALLYVARHLPDRRSEASEPALFDELGALIRAAGGRTLALFTSRRTTELAAASLGALLPYRVLTQGELPKRRLLELFAEEESSCLFATMGFWQGVDIPGRSLSLVTLDRLPFGRPDDPLLEARRERAGDAAFRLIDLPRAATLLAQGAGRLIRAKDDYGVVAVLDPRLATAGYRGVLLSGLPPMRRTTDRRQVEDFFGRVFSEPPDPERQGSPVGGGQ